MKIDVLCIGHAAYDLTFSVPYHPQADEKMFATEYVGCGGGPAANAASTVQKLGGQAAFAGYLGQDSFGEFHLAEMKEMGVDVSLVVRGVSPTPLSVILAKPEGSRSLVNYRGGTKPLPKEAVRFDAVYPQVVLFDGWEPEVSLQWVERSSGGQALTVLDAGSVHRGTELLLNRVDFVVASEKFGRQYTGTDDMATAVSELGKLAKTAVITLGDRGLIWQRGTESGALPAYPVQAIDSTGAGDTFHGAFAYALSQKRPWLDVLRFSSAAAALCCTQYGARLGIPTRREVAEFQSQFAGCF
ncbi:MAG: carbohydrate kinase [Chloroflexi bacterium]|nr:MAG: carbohydrate kinase [Chloroflexota bacterium]